MERWFLELLPLAVQALNEALDFAIAVGAFLPIVNRKHRRHRDRIDAFATGEVRIILRTELPERVKVLERLRIRNGHEVQAGIRRNLREEVDRLGNDACNRIDFTRTQLRQRRRLIDQHLLDIDAQALEDDGASQARAGAGGPEIDLLASQILEALDLVAGENMQLRYRQAHDVVNALLKTLRLSLRAEILEHIRLRDRDVDATQVKKIVKIRRRPARHDRQHAHIVAVVDHRRYFVGHAHLAAGQEAADNADGPRILAVLQLLIGSTLLDGLWHLNSSRRGLCADKAGTQTPDRKGQRCCDCRRTRDTTHTHRATPDACTKIFTLT